VLLPKGPLVERAKLTPQATAGALGYALPAIANAGQAEGEISAGIEESRIPLGDFTQTNLKGVLLIHKATVGASPVMAEVAKLLGAKNTTMTLANEAVVPVQVANGRVYHQNFALTIGGTTLRTNGSVGFDNTLDLVVDVPIPKDLPILKNNPLLVKAVAGKVVKVPVKGTLSQPVLDPKAFEQAVVALAREGAKDVGKDLLDKELNKLFPPIGKKP
jgi:translocation and assembly module TamB